MSSLDRVSGPIPTRVSDHLGPAFSVVPGAEPHVLSLMVEFDVRALAAGPLARLGLGGCRLVCLGRSRLRPLSVRLAGRGCVVVTLGVCLALRGLAAPLHVGTPLFWGHPLIPLASLLAVALGLLPRVLGGASDSSHWMPQTPCGVIYVE
jgi:hypothetical protein